MATYITGNYYEQTLRAEARNKMPWARLAEVVGGITRTQRGYQAVLPLLKRTTATDTEDLGLDGESATAISVDTRDVVIPLRILGKKYQKFDSTATLQETVPDRSLLDRLRLQAEIAMNSIDALAYASVAAVPIDNGSGTGAPANYVHAAGDHGTAPNYYYKPVDDGLVHIGVDANSAASCAALYGEPMVKITAQALRLMVTKLHNANVQPIGYLDAADANSFLYACIMTDSQLLDLRAEVGDNSITSVNKFLSYDNRIFAGMWTVFENLLIFVSPRAKQTYSDGTNEYTVHRCVIFGSNYLVIPATPADELPAAASDMLRVGVFREYTGGEYVGVNESDRPIARIFEIRQVPAYDPQGKMWHISWYAHLGAGILNPKAGIQLITAAS